MLKSNEAIHRQTPHRRRLATIGIGVTALALALTGCTPPPEGGGDAVAGSWEEVEAAAIAEGELTLYSATFEWLNDLEIAAFNEAYPDITVNVVRLPSSDIRDRYGSERTAGAPSADLIKVAAPAIILDDPQWFVDLSEELAPNLVEVDPKFVSDQYVGLYSGPFVWTYNTDLVDEPPVDICTLDDVAADYNGGVRLAVPGPGGGWDSWAIVREACGDDFLRNIGALVASGDIVFYDSSATAVQEVAAGAAAMNAWGQPEHSRALRESGAPVDFAFLENPVWGLAFYAAISADTPNPNAARVYLNWLLSREGVEASCAGTYFTFVYDDIEGCPPSPADLQLEDPAVGAEQGPKIDELLGR